MTPDFRALCLELLQFGDQAGEIAANEGLWPDCDPGPDWLLDRARAALAQPEPEPVVLTRPDCFDFAMDLLGGKEEAEVRNYIERLEFTARAALAHQVVPTNDELLQLAREWNSGHESIDFDFIADYAREVIARYGRSTFHSTEA